jgi:DNA polymerase
MQNGYMPVPGEGSLDARVMFVGEAPGEKEAKTGRPFVGASGKQLDKLLESIKLSRESVFITSVVKDRPPKNRDPLPEEIALYGPLLIAQIDIIQPTVVGTLGRYSLQYLLHYYKSALAGQTISTLHGQPIAVSASYGGLVIMPLYHPAVVLYGQKLKQTLFDDFQALKKLLRKKA